MSPTYASVQTRDSNEEDAQRATAAPEAHLATTTLKVEGMTCGACTSAVEAGFKGVDGIASASISLVMERAVVIHDPKTISADAIKEIIEDRGFDAEVLSTDLPVPAANTSNPKKKSGLLSTTVAIQGMTCGACTSAIEEGFKNVPGVKKFNISLLSERAVVEHDPALLSVQDIAEIIDDRGFEPDIVDSVEAEVEESSSNQEPASNIATTTVAIEGMTCGACTAAVEGGFKGVDGVIKFNISLLAERAVITHDITKLSPEKIAEIIDDRGFDPLVLSTQQETLNHGSGSVTTHLRLYGCSNAGMANAVEEKLKELSGIVAASVTMATERLTVTYQPTAIGLRAIVEAVEAQGLNALLAESQDNNAQLESLAKTKEINEWRLAFRISFAFAVPVFLISMILPMCLPGIDFGKCQIIPGLFLGDIICFVLTVPIQFGIGKRFYVSAFKSLKHGSPTMDVLVMLGTSAAFFFSILTMAVSIVAPPPHSRPHTLFDTSTMLITIICLGRYLENSAKGQTSKALSNLMSLAPSSATIYADPIAAEKALEKWGKKSKGKAEDEVDGPSGSANEERTIPTELLQVGDIVIIKPGDKIPADATLIRGETYVDESMITGEAMPVQKRIGSALIGGTVNGEGRIDCRVTRAGRDTQLSQIVRLVQNAQTTRAPIQQLADTLAGYFIPVILILGMVTFLGWMVLSHTLPNPPKIFTADTSGGKIMVCVKLCISVIVFACPCALGLATPTAVMVGTGVGAENGILIKGGLALQRTTKVTQVVFDKTGTITYGKMSVVQSNLVFDWSEDDWMRRTWWSIIGLAEMGSEHPIGKAILGAAKKELGLAPEATIEGWTDFKATIGQGVEARVEPDSSSGKKRYTVLVGNVKFLQNNGVDIPRNAIEQSEELNSKASKTKVTASAPSSRGAGTTNIFVAIDGKYTGHLCLADKIKEGAVATMSVLRRMGIKTAIVTGDQRSTALAVASVVGIAPEDVYAGVSPDEKQSIIGDIQAQGEIVAMVGDGINDSPALATADVGIALASGTDVAMEAADLVLMRPTELMDIPAALSLTRTIFRRIKLNLAWACVYNLIGLPIAMGFFLPFGLHMHPMFAGFAMACSSVSVVVSSLHLKFWQRPRWMEEAAAEETGGLLWKRRSLVDRVRDLLQSRSRADDKGGYVALESIETV
uniref:P-type Cu(+) transporter n=1 Tax=Bionectria ochroleuca TaxID=29856 RepID=A0A8H7TMX2_BIOOC